MPRPLGVPKESHGKDWVALVLTIGLCTGVNCLTIAVLYDAIFSEGPGLSENATQILVAAFGGMIGVIGSYIGYRAGTIDRKTDTRQPIDNASPPVVKPESEATDLPE